MTSSADRRNHSYWSRPAVVARYVVQDGLTPPETAFLRSAPGLDKARLLDVGVGGGRTAASLADLVAQYRGVDYSAPLIAACRQRFAGTELADRFDVADMRDLSAYPPASFDVVLLGSNSLDYIDHDDRVRALGEIARVTRPGGRLGVSSHNLAAVSLALSLTDRLARLRRDRSGVRLPIAVARHLPRRAASILRNPPVRELLTRRWAFLHDDGVLRRPTRTYYVAPAEMLDQLAVAGYAVLDVFTPAGKTMAPVERMRAADVPWMFWVGRRDDPA